MCIYIRYIYIYMDFVYSICIFNLNKFHKNERKQKIKLLN